MGGSAVCRIQHEGQGRENNTAPPEYSTRGRVERTIQHRQNTARGAGSREQYSTARIQHEGQGRENNTAPPEYSTRGRVERTIQHRQCCICHTAPEGGSFAPCDTFYAPTHTISYLWHGRECCTQNTALRTGSREQYSTRLRLVPLMCPRQIQ